MSRPRDDRLRRLTLIAREPRPRLIPTSKPDPGLRALLARLGRDLLEDNLLGRSAELAYFFLFAFFPFLLFLAALGGFLATPETIPALLDFWKTVAPEELASLVETTLQDLLAQPRGGLLSLAAAGALWAAASGMGSLFSTLNAAYDVKEARSWVRVRILALVTTLAASGFLLVAVVLMLVGDWAARGAIHATGWRELQVFWRSLRWVSIVLALTVALTMVYYVGPSVRQRWRDVLPGTLWAVLGWLGASAGLSLYLRYLPSYNRPFGALGAVIVLLLWMYVTSLVVLIGGKLNALFRHDDAARRSGPHPAPRPREEPAADAGQSRW